jgi:hypothetical protein
MLAKGDDRAWIRDHDVAKADGSIMTVDTNVLIPTMLMTLGRLGGAILNVGTYDKHLRKSGFRVLIASIYCFSAAIPVAPTMTS